MALPARNISLSPADAISKIFDPAGWALFSGQTAQHPTQMITTVSGTANFKDRKVSIERATAILAKKRIQVDDNEVAAILDFLYYISKIREWAEGDRRHQRP